MIVHRLAFEAPSKEFRAVIDGEPLKNMFRLSARAGKHETGGILIGRYADEGATALVDEASEPPPDSRAGPNWFHRGKRGLRELMEARWDNEGRRYYVGEWHFHTAMVPWPSGQDMRQMKEVANDELYDCREPILVIVCPVAKGQWTVKVFVFPQARAPVELGSVELDEETPAM